MSRPFIPAPNTASLEMIYVLFGQTMENVFHVEKSSPYTLADLQALRTVANNWDATEWYAGRGAACQLTRIRTKGLDSLASPYEDYFLPAPRGGTAGGGDLPGNVTFCVKHDTGLTGRSARGRTYVIGITGGSISGNTAISGAWTFWVNKLTDLKTQIAAIGGGSHMVVTSFRSGKAWRSVAVNYPIQTFVAVNPNLDSQRRRLNGRGAP